jgi:hypothetical protein
MNHSRYIGRNPWTEDRPIAAYTGQHNTEKRLDRGSNPRSQCSNGLRLYKPETDPRITDSSGPSIGNLWPQAVRMSCPYSDLSWFTDLLKFTFQLLGPPVLPLWLTN